MSPEYPKKSTKMASAMQVLHAFRPFLRLTAVYNLENFRKPLNVRNVIDFAASSIIFTMGVTCTMLNCWNITQSGFTLSENSGQIVSIMSCAQQYIIYVSMTMNNRSLAKAVECLQITIEDRKLFLSIFSTAFHSFSTIFLAQEDFHITGNISVLSETSRSNKARTVYEKAEEKYTKMHRIISLIGIGMMTSSYLFPAFKPIAFALFNYPTPDKWNLTSGYR